MLVFVGGGLMIDFGGCYYFIGYLPPCGLILEILEPPITLDGGLL